MQKTGTLTFKLAKLMIAVSWADGKIDNPEVDALKELLFSLPELDAKEWAELEIYMDSPVDESEREILLEDVRAALGSTSEKNKVLQTIETLIAIDGNVSEEEKTYNEEIEEIRSIAKSLKIDHSDFIDAKLTIPDIDRKGL